jgi:hypothetical protein
MCYCYRDVREAAAKTDNPIIRELLYDLADVLHDEEWAVDGDILQDDYKKRLFLFSHQWMRKEWREKMQEHWMN